MEIFHVNEQSTFKCLFSGIILLHKYLTFFLFKECRTLYDLYALLCIIFSSFVAYTSRSTMAKVVRIFIIPKWQTNLIKLTPIFPCFELPLRLIHLHSSTSCFPLFRVFHINFYENINFNLS